MQADFQAVQTPYDLAATLLAVNSAGLSPAECDQERSCLASQAEYIEGPKEASRDTPPAHRKKTRCQRRAKKRKLTLEESGGLGDVKKGTQERVLNMVQGLSTSAAAQDLAAAEGGWLGSRKKVKYEHAGELQDSGLRLLQWDGILPHALLDISGRVVAVLAGRARGRGFSEVLREVTCKFERHSRSLPPVESIGDFLPKGKQQARGDFHCVIAGISYGGGQTEPTHTVTPPVYRAVAKELGNSEVMDRLAGFQNQAFQTFFPKIHGYYKENLLKIYQKPHCMRRPHEPSIMPAAAYNLGPVTVCAPHRDSLNLSFGICAITALGDFNPKTGGHLILRELGLKVEFPPGATVLIPSAVITHYNTKVMPGERRYSFTQYAAGGIFNYIKNGMKTEDAYKKDASVTAKEKEEHMEERSRRWQDGLNLFPRLSDYDS